MLLLPVKLYVLLALRECMDCKMGSISVGLKVNYLSTIGTWLGLWLHSCDMSHARRCTIGQAMSPHQPVMQVHDDVIDWSICGSKYTQETNKQLSCQIWSYIYGTQGDWLAAINAASVEFPQTGFNITWADNRKWKVKLQTTVIHLTLGQATELLVHEGFLMQDVCI